MLRIPEPCPESWNAMTPAGDGRHCAKCNKVVADVTQMRPAAAVLFLGEMRAGLLSGQQACVRANVDRSGRLLAPGVTRRLLTNGLAAVIAVTMAGCNGDGPKVGQESASDTPTARSANDSEPQRVEATHESPEIRPDTPIEPERSSRRSAFHKVRFGGCVVIEAPSAPGPTPTEGASEEPALPRANL